MSPVADNGSGVWTDERLDTARQQGDPEADEAIAVLLARPDALALVRQLMGTRFVTAEAAPQPLRSLFQQLQRLPDWLDPKRVEAGERLCLEFGFASSTILACASLPECYSSGSVAKALGFTRFLADKTPRRVLETSQFVMDVMRPGGIVDEHSAPGVGVTSAIKVRLIHATIRHLIRNPPESRFVDTTGAPPVVGVFARQDWDLDRGLPISQADLAFVLLTFSWVAVRTLDKLVGLTTEEADAYIHCWNVIGHVLGIEDDLLAEDAEQAQRLFERLEMRDKESTTEGREMAGSLLAFGRSILPFTLKSLPHVLMRSYLDEETADLLGVKRSSWLERLTADVVGRGWRRFNRHARGLYSESPGISVASVWLHERLLRKWGQMREGGSFDFPSESQAWLLPRLRLSPGTVTRSTRRAT